MNHKLRTPVVLALAMMAVLAAPALPVAAAVSEAHGCRLGVVFPF